MKETIKFCTKCGREHVVTDGPCPKPYCLSDEEIKTAIKPIHRPISDEDWKERCDKLLLPWVMETYRAVAAAAEKATREAMSDEYLTPNEVALTLKVTLTCVYNWIKDGRLVALKAGDLWRIRQSDLEAFLKRPGEG
jgi:excisionase family DNA binding protein